VISTIMNNPADTLVAIGITLAGLPLYGYLKQREKRGAVHNKEGAVP
jgi:hypothetical protein